MRKLDERQLRSRGQQREVSSKSPERGRRDRFPLELELQYWRRRYLPMRDLEIDFPKYAKDFAKSVEVLINIGTGKGTKGIREGIKGEQEQKG